MYLGSAVPSPGWPSPRGLVRRSPKTKSHRQTALKPSIAHHPIAVWPAEGEIKTVEQSGIRIDAFRLRHGGMRK
jgi:hypothetical protein